MEFHFFPCFFSFHLSLIKRRLCFRARSTPQADRLNLLLRVHNPPLKVDARSVLVKWLQVSVTRLCTLGRQTLGFASDLSVSRREFHTSWTGKCVLVFFKNHIKFQTITSPHGLADFISIFVIWSLFRKKQKKKGEEVDRFKTHLHLSTEFGERGGAHVPT